MNARKWLAILLAMLAPPVIVAHAKEGDKEVDTQFIFGFTAGADVGELGEKELEHQTIARSGKGEGAYAAFSDQLRAEFVPARNFRFEIGVPVAFHDISEGTLTIGGTGGSTGW